MSRGSTPWCPSSTRSIFLKDYSSHDFLKTRGVAAGRRRRPHPRQPSGRTDRVRRCRGAQQDLDGQRRTARRRAQDHQGAQSRCAHRGDRASARCRSARCWARAASTSRPRIITRSGSRSFTASRTIMPETEEYGCQQFRLSGPTAFRAGELPGVLHPRLVARRAPRQGLLLAGYPPAMGGRTQPGRRAGADRGGRPVVGRHR